MTDKRKTQKALESTFYRQLWWLLSCWGEVFQSLEYYSYLMYTNKLLWMMLDLVVCVEAHSQVWPLLVDYEFLTCMSEKSTLGMNLKRWNVNCWNYKTHRALFYKNWVFDWSYVLTEFCGRLFPSVEKTCFIWFACDFLWRIIRIKFVARWVWRISSSKQASARVALNALTWFIFQEFPIFKLRVCNFIMSKSMWEKLSNISTGWLQLVV